MTVTYKNGELNLDLIQVFNNLSSTEKKELIESLSFQHEIINYVAKMMTNALKGYDISINSDEIREVINEIAMQADELKAKQFKELNLKLTTALNSNTALRSEMQEMLKETIAPHYSTLKD